MVLQNTPPGSASAGTDMLTALGICCAKCGGTRFATFLQRFSDDTRHIRADCANPACKRFLRWLRQPGSPDFAFEKHPGANLASLEAPPDSWHWIGWIRQDDQVWRPVALAPTLPRCWEALLHYPGRGDPLCIPTRPGKQQATEAA